MNKFLVPFLLFFCFSPSVSAEIEIIIDDEPEIVIIEEHPDVVFVDDESEFIIIDDGF